MFGLTPNDHISERHWKIVGVQVKGKSDAYTLTSLRRPNSTLKHTTPNIDKRLLYTVHMHCNLFLHKKV